MSGEKIRPSFKFVFESGVRLGPGKAQLLELIREHGSIRAAGASIGMSYRRAWLLADEINRMFKQPSIVTQHGGRSGGGTVLTPFGLEVIARYRAMEKKAEKACAEDLDWIGGHIDPAFRRAGKDDD